MRAVVIQYGRLLSLCVLSIAALCLWLVGYGALAYGLTGLTAALYTIPLAISIAKSLLARQFGVDVLALIAVSAALAMGEFAAALVVQIMLAAGAALEQYAQNRARSELKALNDRAPRMAHRLHGNTVVDVAVDDVTVGDTLEVRPGETVPVDGTLLTGESMFDESALTGESLPVEHFKGATIISGSVNQEAVITMQASASSANSQYQQIVALVSEAASSKSPLVRLADQYSVPFTAVSLTIAVLAWLLSGDSLRFLEVLVVATPCPLLIATPVALVSGMSRAARHGIVIKHGGALEQLSRAQTIVFDKTGTLTHGQPELSEVVVAKGFSRQEVLANAAAVEEGSTHVLAAAVVRAAHDLRITIPTANQVTEHSGMGMSGHVHGRIVHIGRLSYLRENGVEGGEEVDDLAAHIAIAHKYGGYVTFTDRLRAETPDTIKRLRMQGISKLMVLSGDRQSIVDAIATQVGIRSAYGELLPAAKLDHLRADHLPRPVVMVGDGINDAPTLAAADVGIALGARGSTAASESADVVIMLDSLTRIPLAVSIARRTIRIAKQSILTGIGLSVILMLIAAGGFIPPVLGAILQEAVDGLVIVNALRAHRGPWPYHKRNPVLR